MFYFLTQLFLYGFGLDAIFSFWSEVYHIKSGALAEFRQLIALSTMAQGCVLYTMMPFTRRISGRLIGLPVLFLLWSNLTECFPLGLFYLPTAGLWMASTQLVIAVLLVAVYWRSRAVPVPSGDEVLYGPGFLDPGREREGFSNKRFFGFLAANFLFLPILLIAFLLNLTISSIEKATAGYVRLRPDGLYITQTRYEKNRQEVNLDGMMHVADAGFYKMKWGVEGMKTLVLLEGVTDQDGLLTHGLGMEKLATLFGLKSQMEQGDYRQAVETLGQNHATSETSDDVKVEMEKEVYVQRADVDVNTFQPQTLRYLREVGALFQSSSVDSAIKLLNEPGSALQNEKIVRGAMEDILTHRNTYLIKKIEEGLKTNDRIVVPWGAMHLAGIEQHLRAQGFVETKRLEKPAIKFWASRPRVPSTL